MQNGASLALALLATMVLAKLRPGNASSLSGPPFCYQCDRACDVELGTIVQCPGQEDQCATFYGDDMFKQIIGRGCLYHRKGCSKLYGNYGFVCTCPEHFCNNRRLMPAFYLDPADQEEIDERNTLVGVDLPAKRTEESTKRAMFPDGELIY